MTVNRLIEPVHSRSFPPSGLTRRGFLRNSGVVLALHAALPRGISWLRADALRFADAAPGCLSLLRTGYPPQLQDIIAKLDPAADAFPSEVYAVEIEKILQTWSAALCQRPHSIGPMGDALSDPLAASSLEPSESKPLRTSGPLRTERRQFGPVESSSRRNFLVGLTAYLAPFASIERVELELYGLRIVHDAPLTIETDLRYDIVGVAKDGRREERVGSWSLSWNRTGQQRWLVDRWVANPEVRSRLTGPGFTEITADFLAAEAPGARQLAAGIDDWRTALDGASGIDVYGNHGIAVGDIDGSGFDSFYVCQPSGLPNRLYRNRGDRTFEDITENSGAGILDGTASAIFADFQNSGRQDLLVVRTAGPLLFVNKGDGKFEPHPNAFQFARAPEGTFTSAAVADYDRDGLLDVYFCVYSYYQGLNQYQYPSPYYDAQNGPPNFLFHNRGDGTFEDVTESTGINQHNDRFSFAAAWCDYDNTGWPSLYVANDFGRKNLYHNNGNGTFTDVADVAAVEDYGPGMSTCWVDYDNDGLEDVYVANMWLKEGKRITANDRFLPEAPPRVRALYQKHNAGNSMYRNNGKGAFDDQTAEAGTSMGRWSWSCAAWDFDHDGYPDLYVANGFVSGQVHDDLQSFFWRQVAERSYGPDGASVDYELAWNAVNELVRADYSWSGYQRNVFFANNHDATFSEVSGVLGLDLVDDSRAFALSDFDHDGRMEFVLKNRTSPQLRILRNDLKGIGNSIAIRLTGQKSNRDAIGAIVTLDVGGKRQTKFVSAGSGFASQHTKELFFGVGDAANTVSASVQWPAGGVDRFEGLPVNHRVEILEGQADFKPTAFRADLAARKPETPALARRTDSGPISTWLVAPLFGPTLKLPGPKGEIYDVSAPSGQLTLLCFFTVDCSDGRKQIEVLQKALPELSAASVAAVAVNVNSATDRPLVDEFRRTAGITLPILFADERTAGAWNIQYRYLFDRRRNMSFPTSFLLDKDGGIVRVYQGVADPVAIVRDANSAPATPAEMFARAMPFPGPYYGIDIKHNYFTFGVAFIEYGYPEEAQAAFERVVAANPAFVAGWFNLGTTYLNNKRYEDARRCLLEAVRLDPKDADAWNNLGMISGEQAKYDEALDEFRNAARANPNSMLAIQNMIRIYEFQKRPRDAQKTLEELIDLSPKNADLHLGLANTLVAQQDLVGARRELEVAANLQANRSDILNNLGVVLLRLGDQSSALDRFDQCQRLSPDFDRPFINAALIYKSQGQVPKAQQLLSGFLARHPENEDVRKAYEKLATP
jgi:tetratricopeptide (TPR) repeat protein/peroxiredoxin